MSKEVIGLIKLQVTAGQANPAPPVGPALGAKGVNIMQFCQQFNEQTKDQMGMLVPVVITVYADRTFSFIIKSPPAAVLIKKALKLAKGSPNSIETKVGTITKAQLAEIATTKMNDLNAYDVETASSIIAGTARSMGVEVEG